MKGSRTIYRGRKTSKCKLSLYNRYQRKNEEMMKMEWANKVAASDRAEAKLYPILSIATSTPAPDVSPGASRTRRNSIYT